MIKKIVKNSDKLLLIGTIMLAIGIVGKTTGNMIVANVGFIVASILMGTPIAIKAIEALKIKMITVDLLTTVAVIGAFIIGEYYESAMVTFLFLFGDWLEEKTLAKTRSSIKELVKLQPTTAKVKLDSGIEEIDVDEIEEGNILVVNAGDSIGADGFVTKGSGYVNEATITGESLAVKKEEGSKVYSGTIVEDGNFELMVENVGEDTTFGKIIELVEEAQDSKTKTQRFLDKFAQYYTPGVMILALIVGLITKDFKLAITLLVIGCPGALILATPVAVVAGIGNGAKNGVLMKGGDAVEKFSKVNTMLFDKTGTLTKGITKVVDKVELNTDNLPLLVAMEKASNHPLGKAILQEYEGQLTDELSNLSINTIKGKGLTTEYNGKEYYVGNEKLIEDLQIITEDVQKNINNFKANGDSIVIFANNTDVLSIYGINDELKEGVKDSFEKLKSSGIKNLVMLTGDNEESAKVIANKLGITKVYANLLPEDKLKILSSYQSKGEQVAFIGDGINDSPALAKADIGIAMGSGTDVAIETSDIVLMTSSFEELEHSYRLAKKTSNIIKENLFIAIFTVFALLLGVLFGKVFMAGGMFIHQLSMVLVIVNGMRLIKFK